MKRTAVLNVVGLTRSLLGEHTPSISKFLKTGALARIKPALPAVTCTAQSDYLTGTLPSEHGVVANGWFNRELGEVHFWKQSNRVVRGRKLWDDVRAAEPGFTCAQLFWWFNMQTSVDWAITPRPLYLADGRKVFDIHTSPLKLRAAIKDSLGEFPFPGFWGPVAGLDSPAGGPDCATRWIAASARWIELEFAPTLSLVYLPHLDYNLQRLGPHHPGIAQDLLAVDMIVGGLLSFYEQRRVQVLLLSEYGITSVQTPVHLNRLFREQGWLAVKDELGRETLDFGESRVFAVADHQVAHIYVNDRSIEPAVRGLLAGQHGIAEVLGADAKAAAGLDHERAGDLVAVAKEDAWFTYYYWLEDDRAPDFARTVDIHRKPGYDPVELFTNPELCCPKLQVAWRLMRKKLGFRMLMDLIPLDARLVKGSHGCRPRNTDDWPVLISSRHDLLGKEELASTEVYEAIRRHVLEGK
ncbi:MAG: alkaline phosphatase family protein [Verrucomicrobia bacterium]|nr:alkaline phosphatase family protein [Verrucomicrobiota bacterium]